MKQTTFATSLVVALLVFAAAAQRDPEPANQPAHNVFVLNGCLEKGDAPTAFRLTGASAVGQAPPRASTSASTDAKDANVYELQATSSVSEQGLSREKLQSEVGMRVEITIRPVESASPAPPVTKSTDVAEKPTESPRQRYTVIKIDRLANSCV